ncbi:MAG: amino acid ABC transporter substrate-binding protein [Desulfovibrionaceae bacterium]
MKRILTLVMVLAAVCFASVAFADGSWEKVQAKGELVIGLDDAFPPMGFRTDDGKLVGFDIDAAEEAGRRLGVKIVWQPTAWKGVINSLNSNKFDAIWNGMTITEERAQQVLFSKPYMMDGQIAVVRMAETEVATLEALGGKSVGVQAGSPALEAAKSLPMAPAQIREYDDNPKAFLDLESGRLAAVVVDNLSGLYFTAAQPGKFKSLPGFITKEPFGVAFRKDDVALRDKVQGAIDAMIQDGTMAKISIKWFGEDITNPANF